MVTGVLTIPTYLLKELKAVEWKYLCSISVLWPRQLLYRNQLWPLSVPARLDEKIMEPGLWCIHTYTLYSHCVLAPNTVFSTARPPKNTQSQVGILIIVHCFAEIFHIFLPVSPRLCSCEHSGRILGDVTGSPDPNRRGSYIAHDRVRGDEKPGRIQSVKSLTDDNRNEVYVCSTGPGGSCGSWGGWGDLWWWGGGGGLTSYSETLATYFHVLYSIVVDCHLVVTSRAQHNIHPHYSDRQTLPHSFIPGIHLCSNWNNLQIQ